MGRVTLINSVPISIHSYWAQIMILPKKLLKDVEAICRAFLWKGISDSHIPGLIAWENICVSRAAGGLGFRRLHDWNMAAMGKYVWAIAKKKDNLFVKWINSVYLLNQNWWDYKCPTDCSWYWKCLVAVKDSFKVKISQDSFLSQKYTIKCGLDLLTPQESRVPWRKFVWDRLITPKHRFLMWLVMWERLHTKDRIVKYKPNLDQSINLTRLLHWISHANLISSTYKSMLFSFLAGTVYHIWRVRNDALWNHKLWQVQHTIIYRG
ncbi:uncharacterized protein LOC133831237 [Humulus lupulus]|uniref:uncharacterized protein LOC133831237 n=1 Tax=Humulus lupulus TaxID=3486 RepID=UPI002B413A33|nr:uncharacterized protein LOC133831237 [Humulus lupulus]